MLREMTNSEPWILVTVLATVFGIMDFFGIRTFLIECVRGVSRSRVGQSGAMWKIVGGAVPVVAGIGADELFHHHVPLGDLPNDEVSPNYVEPDHDVIAPQDVSPINLPNIDLVEPTVDLIGNLTDLGNLS